MPIRNCLTGRNRIAYKLVEGIHQCLVKGPHSPSWDDYSEIVKTQLLLLNNLYPKCHIQKKMIKKNKSSCFGASAPDTEFTVYNIVVHYYRIIHVRNAFL